MSKCEVEALERELEEAKRERDQLRAENERLRQRTGGMPDPYYEVQPGSPNFEGGAAWERYCDEQETGQADEWRTHDSHEPPADLAAAQLVEVKGAAGGDILARRAVSRLAWYPCLRYRPALSANGDWLCSGEGLEPWAKYVTTAINGRVRQHSEKPFLAENGVWVLGGFSLCGGPETHRRPGPASESLMEVSRD